MLAAVAGILYGLAYPKIDPLMGIMPGLKAFVAAVLGGIGNVPGAVVGGLMIGVIEAFVGGSQFSNYRDAIAFVIGSTTAAAVVGKTTQLIVAEQPSREHMINSVIEHFTLAARRSI